MGNFVVHVLKQLERTGGIQIRTIARNAVLDAAGQNRQRSAGMNDDEPDVLILRQHAVP